jgi:hypothetical protein
VKSPQAYLLLLLAGTTVGGAILAWKQYGELVELRASAMNRDERADLQKRIWDLEKLNRELQDQLATTRESGSGDATVATTSEASSATRDRGGRGGPGGRGESFQKQAAAVRELMSSKGLRSRPATRRSSAT